MAVAQPRVEVTHKFWDKQNKFLFIAVRRGRRRRFRSHARQPAKRRPRTESDGASLRPLQRRPGDELRGRDRRSHQPQLLLPQDRASQNGESGIDRKYCVVNGSGELRTHAPLSDIYSFRASPHPLRYNGIIHLGENRPIISGAQSLAGKILNPKYLPRALAPRVRTMSAFRGCTSSVRWRKGGCHKIRMHACAKKVRLDKERPRFAARPLS